MPLKFGVGLPYRSKDFNHLLKFASAAEKMGLDSLWIADHGYLPWEALTTLSAVAVKTKNIRIGTSVIDANRRNPATLAQMVATVDNISHGRFIFGVGSGHGGTNPVGFRVNKPALRMRESLEVIKKFWTEPEVNYKGRFYTFEGASLGVKPIQKPHPPIWIAAFGPTMMKTVAEFGDGLITQNISPELYEEELSNLRNLANREGRDPTKIEPVFAAPMSISEDYAAALRDVEPLARRYLLTSGPHIPHLSERMGYEKPWTRPEEVPIEAMDRCFIFGAPNDWINKIEKYVKSGVKYFVPLLLMPPGTEEKKLRLYHKVVSHFVE